MSMFDVDADGTDHPTASPQPRNACMLDAIVISDLHLGSDNCQAKQLTRFLEAILDDHTPTARLILNGDMFDSIDFRRLKKHHWKVLSLIRKLSDKVEIVWINGNHDGSSEIVSHLLGVTVSDEYELVSGQRRILFLHGHIFDRFIVEHPLITYLADCVYCLLQKIDRTHTIARMAKSRSKTFLRCVQKIRDESVAYAHRKGYDIVCCGHTHQPTADTTGPVHYFNSGCWTELPCSYLTVQDGQVQLHSFVLPGGEAQADELIPADLAVANAVSVS